MSSLFALNQLIGMTEKYMNPDTSQNSNRTFLKTLQKYRVINPTDIADKDKSPDVEDILAKFLSLVEHSNGRKYKLLILVRHGQGVHNWAKDLKYKDAHLTQTGIDQVKKILPRLKCIESRLDFIVSSPLHRALETATHALLPLVEIDDHNMDNEINEVIHKYKCPVYVLEYSRENVNKQSCNQRSNLNDIQKEWKEYDFEYKGFATNEDNQWNGVETEKMQSLWKRSAKMMDFIWNTEGNAVAYSGHSEFIMSLMDVILNMPFYNPRNGAYVPIIITTI